MLKKQLTTDPRRRPVSAFKKTFHCLCNLTICFCQEAFVKPLQCLCDQGLILYFQRKKIGNSCFHKGSYLGYKTLVVIKTSQVIIRPYKKISVFQVTGLKFLGRVGTHIFFSAFQNA